MISLYGRSINEMYIVNKISVYVGHSTVIGVRNIDNEGHPTTTEFHVYFINSKKNHEFINFYLVFYTSLYYRLF